MVVAAPQRLNEDLLAAPDNLLVGTVDALEGDGIASSFASFDVDVGPESSFSGALADEELDGYYVQLDFTAAESAFSSGDYADASDGYATGSLLEAAGLEELLVGAVTSF